MFRRYKENRDFEQATGHIEYEAMGSFLNNKDRESFLEFCKKTASPVQIYLFSRFRIPRDDSGM